jgi:hypothetical protein
MDRKRNLRRIKEMARAEERAEPLPPAIVEALDAYGQAVAFCSPEAAQEWRAKLEEAIRGAIAGAAKE